MPRLQLPRIEKLPAASGAKPSAAPRSRLLPEIGRHIDARVSSIVEVTNPSTVSPSTQQFAAPTIDQTKKVTRTAGGIVDSDGQVQRLDLEPGQQGVGVTEMPMFRGSFRGERYHQTNLDPIDQGVRVRFPAGGRKPVVNVDVASQNVSRPRPTKALALPPAININADKTKHAGLPTNHNIR